MKFDFLLLSSIVFATPMNGGAEMSEKTLLSHLKTLRSLLPEVEKEAKSLLYNGKTINNDVLDEIRRDLAKKNGVEAWILKHKDAQGPYNIWLNQFWKSLDNPDKEGATSGAGAVHGGMD